MNKDTIHLTNLYEQILLTEDSELSRFGFSREFINSLFTKYNIPHDAKFTKLTKIPSLNDMNNYGVVIARLKGKEGGIVIVRDRLYDFDGKEIGKYTSSSYTFVTVKSAVDKDSIYGMVGGNYLEKRKDLKDKEFFPLGEDIFNILQTKFGKMFREKIKNLQDYIYTNIRTFKHTRVVKRGRPFGADILEVMDVLIKLTNIDKFSGTKFIRDKDENWKSEYNTVMRETINKFLEPYGGSHAHELAQTYRDFVKHFNEHPSYVKLAKLFLQSLDAYEDEVLYYIHSDYFKNIPPEHHEIKLKEIKEKELTDAAYKDIELADLYDF